MSGNDDTLVITEFVSYGDDDEDDGYDVNGNTDGVALGGTPGRLATRAHLDNEGLDRQVRILMSSVNSLRRQNDDLKNELILFKEANSNMTKQMNSSIKRSSMLPVYKVDSTSTNNGVDRRVDTTSRQLTIGRATVDALSVNDGIGNGGYETTLSKYPRSLYVLWQEYQFGIGGR